MKKIRFNSLSLIDRDVLRASWREKLLAQDAEIRGMGRHVVIKEAWGLTRGRIKIKGEVRLDDGSFYNFTRVIEMKSKADCLPLELVNVIATPAALEAISAAGQTLDYFLEKHRSGDWGNLCDEDATFYDRALVAGSTVFGEYLTDNFNRIHIYTAIGSYTSVYMPGER